MSTFCEVGINLDETFETFHLPWGDQLLAALITISTKAEITLTLASTDEATTLLSQLRARSSSASMDLVELSKLSTEDRKCIKMLSCEIEELPTSKRLHGCIKASGCKRVWEICIKTEKEWLVEKNFGRVSLRELKEILAKMGLSLNMRQQILTWRYFLPTGK